MRLLATGLAALFTIGALAQADTPAVQIQPLYNSDAVVTKFLIPYRLNGLHAASDVVSFTVLDFPVPCGLMRDPFHYEVFLLKCDQPATPRLEFVVLSASGPQTIHFGPIAVAGADGTAAPPPVATPTPTPLPSGGTAGKQIFNQYCLSACHTSAGGMGAPSVAFIHLKLTTEPQMASFQTLLSETDIQNISTYLANPGAY